MGRITQSHHRINIFFEMCLRSLKEVTWKSSFLRYILSALKMSRKRYIFFEMYLSRLERRLKKASLLRCIWDVFKMSKKRHLFDIYLSCLKDVTKRRLFWDVSEWSLRCFSQWRLRHLKDISCWLGRSFYKTSKRSPSATLIWLFWKLLLHGNY